jgi:hypothetical protein
MTLEQELSFDPHDAGAEGVQQSVQPSLESRPGEPAFGSQENARDALQMVQSGIALQTGPCHRRACPAEQEGWRYPIIASADRREGVECR